MEYKGLTSKQAEQSRAEFGANILTPKERRTLLSRFIESFGDPIIKILLSALAINVLFLFRSGDWLESLGIALAVFLATFVSVVSEAGSENAFERLQQESNMQKARVIRDGELCEILASEVVNGDVIKLQAGEKIVADGIVLQGDFSCDQSALNGESKEAKKQRTTNNKQRTTFDDFAEAKSDFLDKNKVFSGTIVTNGEGIMQVTAVGASSFYGKLADDLHSTDIQDSPLKTRLTDFAKIISRFGYIAAFVAGFAFVFNQVYILGNFANWIDIANHVLKALTLAVSIIVMAVPEGLPMMITIVLSRNMRKMLKDNVLVRKLVGIETAGSLNVLFADKTGTLTNGKLKVADVLLAPGVEISVLKNAIRNNCSAEIGRKGVIGGNSTDRALLEWAGGACNRHHKSRIPFNSTNKFMATTLGDGTTYIKGAPEVISKSQMKNFQFADGMRYIAVATCEGNFQTKLLATNHYPLNTRFLGFVGMQDTLRRNISKTVHDIKKAGIDVVMITGDSKVTATEIANQSGILSHDGELVLTSAELAEMSDLDIAEKLPYIKVIARALPTDKSRLVKIAQSLGLVCGMTGDGVNDAPALSNADVGFAMGSGTEVAKEAADIVVLDDNLSSICKAICYGRTIFKNIRKFIAYQLTVSMGAVGISIIGPFIGIDNPITVIQMLWINIVMDTLAGLAFAGEMALERYMKERPKRRDERIMTRGMWGQIIICGGTIATICLAFLLLAPKTSHFETAFFALFMFLAIFMSFNARTDSPNLLEFMSGNKAFIAIMSFVTLSQVAIIYFGGSAFRTHGLPLNMIICVVLLAVIIIPIDFIRKMILRKVRNV